MAHAAEIDANNIVTRVIVVPDAHENRIQDFCANDLGLGGTWLQTSYNGRIRKNYAGVGMSYDAERDAFIPPQPYPSWTLNENTCLWEAPVPMPTWVRYEWDETTKEWITVTNG